MRRYGRFSGGLGLVEGVITANICRQMRPKVRGAEIGANLWFERDLHHIVSFYHLQVAL